MKRKGREAKGRAGVNTATNYECHIQLRIFDTLIDFIRLLYKSERDRERERERER